MFVETRSTYPSSMITPLECTDTTNHPCLLARASGELILVNYDACPFRDRGSRLPDASYIFSIVCAF
jgi:hypothetical protein